MVHAMEIAGNIGRSGGDVNRKNPNGVAVGGEAGEHKVRPSSL
jgi:hypothetical protein